MSSTDGAELGMNGADGAEPGMNGVRSRWSFV